MFNFYYYFFLEKVLKIHNYHFSKTHLTYFGILPITLISNPRFLKLKFNKFKFRRLKNWRFLFWRFKKWNNRFFYTSKIHYKIRSSKLRVGSRLFGFSSDMYKRWYFFFKGKRRFRPIKFRVRSFKSGLFKNNLIKDKRRTSLIGNSSLYKTNYDYSINFNLDREIGSFIHTGNIWKFAKYMYVDNLFNFDVLYSIKFTRIFRDFIGLYMFLKCNYLFSRNKIFKVNKFGLVYGITHLIFFKTFFYLKLAFISFFSNTHFKRHRLLLLILGKFLRVNLLDFYKSYGFFGCEISFFGKLGGFGGSQKKRYRVSIGSRASMSIKFRVHQHLYEYSTPHGRIGSKCKITLRN